jgi:hypothetical protein
LASIINSTDTGSGGLITTGDSSDELQIQTAETTAVTITSGQQSAFIAGTAAAPAVTTTGDLNTGIYFPAADNIGFATGGTIRGRWTTDGLCFGTDTAAANALDDYEEGTWTGTLGGSVSAPSTLVTATGKYVKIGKQVTLAIVYENVNTTGGSGNVYISGIPFTGDTKGGGSASSHSFNFSAGQTSLASEINTALSFVVLITSGSGAAFSELQYGAGAGRYLNVGVTYFTA